MFTIIGFCMLLAAMNDGSVWPAYTGSLLVLTSGRPAFILIAALMSFNAGADVAGWIGLAVMVVALLYERGHVGRLP